MNNACAVNTCHSGSWSLVLVLFILLVIIGAAWVY